jgi:hypothetical protein
LESNNTIKIIFELSQNNLEIITLIRDLFPSLKNNIWFDRGTYRLSFSGMPAKEQLIEYLNRHPLLSHKNIVFLKWKKANQLLRVKGSDWKSLIIKLSEHLNQWRVKDRVRSSLKK